MVDSETGISVSERLRFLARSGEFGHTLKGTRFRARFGDGALLGMRLRFVGSGDALQSKVA